MIEPCPNWKCRSETGYESDIDYCDDCGITFVRTDIDIDDSFTESLIGLRGFYPGWTDDQIISKAIFTSLRAYSKLDDSE